MFTDFILSAFAIAAIGKLWNKLQKDFPTLKANIKNKAPHLVSKALSCSLCFTFWKSLIFVLIFDPLRGWLPVERFYIHEHIKFLLSIFLSWMIVGAGSWLVRFMIDELQLLVHYQNHILKERSGHN